MPVSASKLLSSGNRATFRLEIKNGNAKVKITYDKEPTLDDKTEANGMIDSIMILGGYEKAK